MLCSFRKGGSLATDSTLFKVGKEKRLTRDMSSSGLRSRRAISRWPSAIEAASAWFIVKSTSSSCQVSRISPPVAWWTAQCSKDFQLYGAVAQQCWYGAEVEHNRDGVGPHSCAYLFPSKLLMARVANSLSAPLPSKASVQLAPASMRANGLELVSIFSEPRPLVLHGGKAADRPEAARCPCAATSVTVSRPGSQFSIGLQGFQGSTATWESKRPA